MRALSTAVTLHCARTASPFANAVPYLDNTCKDTPCLLLRVPLCQAPAPCCLALDRLCPGRVSRPPWMSIPISASATVFWEDSIKECAIASTKRASSVPHALFALPLLPPRRVPLFFLSRYSSVLGGGTSYSWRFAQTHISLCSSRAREKNIDIGWIQIPSPRPPW